MEIAAAPASTAAPASAAPVLRLRRISKRFGPLLANDGVSLTLARGEVLALLGENGAGKSTLMSILFGHYRADAGTIEVFGQPLAPGNPKAALAAGIGMVHQHFALADNLTVLDNVMLGSERWWQPFTRRQAARQRLLEVAQRFGLAVRPDALVGALSVGERQRVEIVKALYRGARILILDEPTAVLTPQESVDLFATLARMVADGLSIVFISHKLGEVLRVSHRIAVLRHGRLVAEVPAAGATQAQLATAMVGHAVDSTACRSARPSATGLPAAPVCVLDEVHTRGARDALHGVSLELRAGEIVAVAGISGNGQVALAELLCGTRRPSAGRVLLDGAPLPAAPARLVALGVARIPEDRHAVGLVGDLPLWENAVSERLRDPALRVGPFVRRGAARAQAARIVQAFDVRGGGLDAPARALSGGNMQKLILGRALLRPAAVGATALRARTGAAPDADAHASAVRSSNSAGRAQAAQAAEPAGSIQTWPADARSPSAQASTSGEQPPRPTAPRLIVAHQPTWGLDIGAVAYVQQQLIAARDAGAAVLLISDDLDEVLMLGDRVAVMHAGHLSKPRRAADWTREAIGLAMAGAASGAAESTA